MVDYEALSRELKTSGYKHKYLAKRMGLSDSGLRNKIQGKTGFKLNEVELLARLLNLSAEDRDRIFFQKVHVDFDIYQKGDPR